MRRRRLGRGEPAELVEHLGELRTRLFVSLLAIAAGFAVAFAFHGHIVEWLTQPLPGDRRPVTFGVAEPFVTAVKVSLYAGFALALPVVLWQAWRFLAPAISEQAERSLARLVAFGSALFAAGIAFGYVVALPAALRFLTTFDADVYDIEVRAKDYYSFVLMTLLATALVFELPVFVLGLVRLGVTTSERLRRSRRLGYVVVCAVAVALPGVDPVTTAFEMVPLLVLYEASIWLAAAFERRWASAAATAAAS